MTGTLEDDVMLGFEGNDLLIGGGGADTLKGGPGSNTASYQTAKAGLFAGLEDTGANSGDAAGDTYVDIQNLTGSNFADTLYGDGYANMFKGGAGNDLMVGKGAGDRFLGGAGSGTVGYDADYFGVIADLMKPGRNTGTAAGDTYSSIENLAGSTYNDKLYGDDRANTLASNVYPDTPSGDDQLYGRGGNDHLKGYDGVDRLEGGAGRDILSGGTSSDVFAFAEKLTAANWDTITDFSHAEDRIDIDNAVFAGMDLGMLSAGRFKAIASATSRSGVDAGDRILYDKAHGDLYFDRDGSGHRFDREKFASVADGTALDHTDIFVF
jgi:serralysin